jgi:hypothetical protein
MPLVLKMPPIYPIASSLFSQSELNFISSIIGKLLISTVFLLIFKNLSLI